MLNLTSHLSDPHRTAQNAPIPGREAEMAPNAAGGYGFVRDNFRQLQHWLITGSEGGTYSAGEAELTQENVKVLEACLKEDGVRVVRLVQEIAEAGRAPKKDYGVFALATALTKGDLPTRRAAMAAVPEVCEYATLLFQFLTYVQQIRARDGLTGWGRLIRKAVLAWLEARPVDSLALQSVKYPTRNGWTWRDVLRRVHPKAEHAPVGAAPVEILTTPGATVDHVFSQVEVGTRQRNAVYHYMARGWENVGETPHPEEPLQIIWAAERVKTLPWNAAKTHENAVLDLIRTYRLPREVIPSEWLREASVWNALLPHMGVTALVRNLGQMTQNGTIAPFAPAVAEIVAKLTDAKYVRQGKIHPFAVLVALAVYKSGKALTGGSTWTANAQILAALDTAFYNAFANVDPTGLNTLLALDVSGSMNTPVRYNRNGTILALPLTVREAAAAMAMVVARTEPNHYFVGFSGQMVPLDITREDRLSDVIAKTSDLPMGPTDCALPMLYASGYNRENVLGRGARTWADLYKMREATSYVKTHDPLPVDTFVVYTDSETWQGEIHTSQALTAYKRDTNRDSRLVVCAMTGINTTIADPKRTDMLDISGWDAAAPQILADFARGLL